MNHFVLGTPSVSGYVGSFIEKRAPGGYLCPYLEKGCHYTNPNIFHQTDATRIRIPKRIGVATRPTFVRSLDLKYR